jgi:hypothetical protein
MIHEYGEPLWNGTDRGKGKNSEKTLSQCKEEELLALLINLLIIISVMNYPCRAEASSRVSVPCL